jgi:hypothetical protein
MNRIDSIHVAPAVERKAEPGAFRAALRASSATDGGVPAAREPSTSSGSGEGDVLEATRALQQEARTFNLQYIRLQESMQRESREFTALSNVMRVKHDSAKAAIDNIH